jgi:hypothetical protein
MRLTPIVGPIFVTVGLRFGFGQAFAAVPDTPKVEVGPEVAAEVLWVEVSPGPAQLEPEAIRLAIENELGLPTLKTPDKPYFGRVSVEGVAGPAVIVRYQSRDLTTKLERRVALPVDQARRSLVVSWIVGNLVRNEAAEILSGMVRRPSTDTAEAPAPLPTQPSVTELAPSAKRETPASSRPPSVPKPRLVVPKPTPTKEPDLGRARLIQLALYSPDIALYRDAQQHRYHLGLGGVYSRVGALEGFGFTWLVDRVDYHTQGAAISGIWSQSNDTRGVLFAGVGTYARGDLTGADFVGVLTLRQGCVFGAQIAGVVATAASHCKSLEHGSLRLDRKALLGIQFSGAVAYIGSGFRGAQVAGVTSIATDGAEGLQLAGAVALAQAGFRGVQVGLVGDVGGGQMQGIQLSGLFNYQSGDTTGLQLAGGLNRSDDLHGMQLGLVNVGRDVFGLQLGIVNLARENHGLALGLFNWSKGARLQPTYFFQTPGLHSIGFKTISGHATSSVSFGYDEARDIARTHFAVGARSSLDRFGVGLELGYGWVLENFSTTRTDRAHELDLIGTVTLEILPRVLSVYGGGGAAMPVAGVVPIVPHGLAQAGISFF